MKQLPPILTLALLVLLAGLLPSRAVQARTDSPEYGAAGGEQPGQEHQQREREGGRKLLHVAYLSGEPRLCDTQRTRPAAVPRNP